MKVGFVTMEKFENRPKGSVGSSRIRARWVYKNWDEAEEYQVGRDYDVLVFQKVYWERMLDNFDGMKIFDICDADWLEPRPVMEMSNRCDYVTTSSDALTEYIGKLTETPVETVSDRKDFDEYETTKESHEGIAKTAVWFGYAHNYKYLNYAVEVIAENNLTLTVISNDPYVVPSGLPRIDVKYIKYNQDKVHKNIIENDMLILPQPDDYRGSFKSNNKTTDGWALKMPVALNPDDVERFMNSEERQKEADEKYKKVREEYDVKLSVKDYKRIIEST